MELISTVGLGLLSSVIYDTVKFVTGKFIGKIEACKKEKDLLDRINQELYVGVSDECKTVLNSSTFINFLNSYRFLDLVNVYLEQKIITNYSSQKSAVKKYIKTNTIITTEVFINHITDKLMELYNENEILTIPQRCDIYGALEHIFIVCEKTIASTLSPDNAKILYLIDGKIDGIGNKIVNEISGLQSVLQALEKKLFGLQPNIDDYEKTRKQYHEVLKLKNSEARIHLLDKFPFDSFYVPPVLCKSTGQIEYSIRSIIVHSHVTPWDSIFNHNNIVYVIGGAGYGKSLFQKKIINDHQSLNIFRSDEYIVIYGELKSFYESNTSTPISVVEFLRNSIKTSTLIDVTTDFIQYYLDAGRCIILLDALDEVDKNKRSSLHETVTSFFKKQNPNNKICITSRERGFIPEKNIEVFNICPLNRQQIEQYVDNIIALGKFDEEDRESFLKQTEVLVRKEFLNSFLVLSLLISIYKAERELPENKLDLYQKCFEYVANKREQEKTPVEFDWAKISPLMKDNTFIELSKMCVPNNSNVDKDTIKDNLLKVYRTKFISEVDAENALDEFLRFCSERTELFVPFGEDKFKFFHRSFFEYFYSKYITLRIHNAELRLNELMKFDIDAEVFELTVAMLKQHSEEEYQELIELMFDKALDELQANRSNFQIFNILILAMQVVDDALYREKYANIIVEYKSVILKHPYRFQNLYLIIDTFKDCQEYINKICDAYEEEALYSLLKNCVTLFAIIDESKDFGGLKILDKEITFKEMITLNRRILFDRKDDWDSFYAKMYLKTKDCHKILSTIEEDRILTVHKHFRANNYKNPAEVAINAVNRYRKLTKSRQKNALKLIVSYFGMLDEMIFIA